MASRLSSIIKKLNLTNNFIANNSEVQKCIELLNITPTYPIILVGGTNGKGSTCAYLSSILVEAGFKVGTFTSPHVFNYNERICLNSEPINDNTLADTLETILNHYNPGVFKSFTLAAHLIFIQKNIDIAVIEVGLGGKNDVTNLFEPYISAITNVSMDHADILGDTTEKIALEKAGIFRPGKVGFYGHNHPPQNLVEYAKDIGCKLKISNHDFGINPHDYSFDIWSGNNNYYALPYPPMRSTQQLENIALSLAILENLPAKFTITLSQIKQGILNSKLVGRFEILPGLPQIILDVAHNYDSVNHMLKNMLKLTPIERSFAVFGIANNKDIESLIAICADKFDHWFIAKINSARAIENSELVKIMQHCNIEIDKISCCDSLVNAFKQAQQKAKATDRICGFGSFLVVEEIHRYLKAN